jgi:hypothetical protein
MNIQKQLRKSNFLIEPGMTGEVIGLAPGGPDTILVSVLGHVVVCKLPHIVTSTISDDSLLPKNQKV